MERYPSAKFTIGQRVRVVSSSMTTSRNSKVAEIRCSFTGYTIYVLEDGGFVSANELEPR